MACSTCPHKDVARVAIIEDHPCIVEHTPLPDHVVFVAVMFHVLDVARSLTSETETRVIEVGGSGGESVYFLQSHDTKVSVLLTRQRKRWIVRKGILNGELCPDKGDRGEDLQVSRWRWLEDRQKGNRELKR